MAVVPKIRVKVLPQQKLRLRMTPAVPGTPGDDGDAATIAVGSVTTLPAGQPATVTNVGTPAAAIFDFAIPQGEDGSGTGDMLAATYDPQAIGNDAFDRANHTGTQLAATISDFSTAADARVSAAIGVTVQAYDADLTAWAGVNPSSYSTTAQIAAAYQPLDSDLTSWAGVTRASGFDAFAATPSSANLRALLTDEVGTGAAYFVGGALGTPASATLTNATGLPVSTGISGLGSNMATFLATPSSANLRGTLTDETGTGAAVFATSPAIATPALTDPVITGSITEDVFTITDAAGFAIDPRNGSVQEITLGANRTPVAANWVSGDAITLRIADGTAFTITWTTIGVVWVGGSAPTLATSGFTHVVLWRVGTTYYGKYIGDTAS